MTEKSATAATCRPPARKAGPGVIIDMLVELAFIRDAIWELTSDAAMDNDGLANGSASVLVPLGYDVLRPTAIL